MKLHTVFITHNRLECTKQAMRSYFDTVTVPFTVHVYDNGSNWDTTEWLARNAAHKDWGGKYELTLDDNRYPGYAANHGWETAPADATHFQRADNDFIFLPGWCDAVEAAFADQGRRHVGQVGLRTDDQEVWVDAQGGRHPVTSNVGGNNIILRELWDAGLRYDERPWPQIALEEGGGITEDSLLSPAVRKMGYVWTRVQTQCIDCIADEDPYDPYYLKTWEDRGLLDWALDAYGIKR